MKKEFIIFGLVIMLMGCHEVPKLELSLFDPENPVELIHVESVEFIPEHVNGQDAVVLNFEITEAALAEEDLIDDMVLYKNDDNGWLMRINRTSFSDVQIASGEVNCYQFGLVVGGDITKLTEPMCVTIP